MTATNPKGPPNIPIIVAKSTFTFEFDKVKGTLTINGVPHTVDLYLDSKLIEKDQLKHHEKIILGMVNKLKTAIETGQAHPIDNAKEINLTDRPGGELEVEYRGDPTAAVADKVNKAASTVFKHFIIRAGQGFEWEASGKAQPEKKRAEEKETKEREEKHVSSKQPASQLNQNRPIPQITDKTRILEYVRMKIGEEFVKDHHDELAKVSENFATANATYPWGIADNSNIKDILLVACSDISSIQTMAIDFNHEVQPLYLQKFPRSPAYTGPDGNKVTIDQPHFGHSQKGEDLNYDEYAKMVDNGLVPVRSLHGVMHGARVSLLSLMLIEMLRKNGTGIGQPPGLVALAGGFHDTGRQDEGGDYWDKESADNMRAFMLKNKFDDSVIYEALAGKNSQQNPSIVKNVIHDADCLDIMRLHPLNGGFRPELLSLKMIDQKLQQEVQNFISITENVQIKSMLEKSQDPIRELLSIFNYLNRANTYPLMAEYLTPALMALSPPSLALNMPLYNVLELLVSII